MGIQARQPRSAQILTADLVQQQPIAAPEKSEINHGIHRNQRFPEEPKHLQDKDLSAHNFAKKLLSWYAPNIRP